MAPLRLLAVLTATDVHYLAGFLTMISTPDDVESDYSASGYYKPAVKKAAAHVLNYTVLRIGLTQWLASSM